ncbi:MAG: hypothetical protein E5V74_08965 [Mesorhizobium sp.]|nr:MAG: hypothetical protein E5W03_03190 [Mesorhizobium sp.]TIV23274.1 MAG: hypothetical protein E5W02_06210 [Mesorhizobium sp.]TIV64141.1 MAG: hypothetical protein E5V86_16400 [Mesorhizobium sp.]TIW03503.1 MAG: hypothetical protein E5V74_08965 [Mesorhizobium sp.]
MGRDGFGVEIAYVVLSIAALVLVLFAALWQHRRSAVVVSAEEMIRLKMLPLFTNNWGDEDWSKWRRLMDADLAQISDVEGDFGPSYMLVLTPAGERALRV